jgi:transposase-like protein
MEQITKEKIIAEYLAGGTSYRKLHEKYGYSFQIIQRWVQQYKGNDIYFYKPKKTIIKETPEVEADLPKDVKQLQTELRKVKLHNKLLEALLDIGKEQYNLDLRKKTGTKRS